MPSRSSSQWQSRRKQSLGQIRRAHPASGATWNVQVVRGKITSKCLWHACRALALGMVLMLLGGGMATVGYYANQLSVGHEIRGNATVQVKNESRGYHLNNLSYVGPIVMGFGGFIVVAACVMTFEARDSAAKVVPARFQVQNSSRTNVRSNTSSSTSTRREMMLQSNRWDHHLGVFHTSPGEPPPQVTPMDREALTAALIHFSKAMSKTPQQSPKGRRLSRSGSEPNLASIPSLNAHSIHVSPAFHKKLELDQGSHHHHRHQHGHGHGRHLPHHKTNRVSSSLINRASRDSASSLLHPGMLYYYRHALSVDETGPYLQSHLLSHDSQSSMIIPDIHDSRNRDRTSRSDTAKKHVLARQKPIENEEPNSPKTRYSNDRRRSSTASDISFASRHIYRRTPTTSRTPSIDSRSVHVELHSPEKVRQSPRTPKRFNSGQSSTPSVERELRSQLSICSEPTGPVRQLSGQSSLEPCVLEESPEFEEKERILGSLEHFFKTDGQSNINSVNENDSPDECLFHVNGKKSRPNSLVLKATVEPQNRTKSSDSKKVLYRSSSSRTYHRPKPRLINEYDPIYFISTDGTVSTRPFDKDEELYDSLKVIDERRSKILTTTAESTDSTASEVVKPSGRLSRLESADASEELNEENEPCEVVADIQAMPENSVILYENDHPLREQDEADAIINDADACGEDVNCEQLDSLASTSATILTEKEKLCLEFTETQPLDIRVILESDSE